MKIIDGSKSFNMNNVMFEGKPQELMYSCVSKKITSYSLRRGGAGNNFKIFFQRRDRKRREKRETELRKPWASTMWGQKRWHSEMPKTAEASLKDVVWRRAPNLGA